MNRWVAAAALTVAGLLAWATSAPAVQPLPELVPVGAREVVPRGYPEVLAVLSNRAINLQSEHRRRLARTVAEESNAAGFDPLLVLAVIDVESDFEQASISQAGARGLMQIRPLTLGWLASQAGVDDVPAALEQDPTFDVRLGIRYLKTLKDRFGTLDRALFAYNLGPAKMIRVWKAHGLGQYQGYLHAVKRDYAQLQRETGAKEDWTLASR